MGHQHENIGRCYSEKCNGWTGFAKKDISDRRNSGLNIQGSFIGIQCNRVCLC